MLRCLPEYKNPATTGEQTRPGCKVFRFWILSNSQQRSLTSSDMKQVNKPTGPPNKAVLLPKQSNA